MDNFYFYWIRRVMGLPSLSSKALADSVTVSEIKASGT